AAARRTRGARGRAGDRALDGGEGLRTLDRRDVSDVPASSAQRAAGRRSRDRKRDSAALRSAQAARAPKNSAARRSVEAVSIGGVLVFVADAQKRAFNHKTRKPSAIAIRVPRSLKSVSRQEKVIGGLTGLRAPTDGIHRGTLAM